MGRRDGSSEYLRFYRCDLVTLLISKVERFLDPVDPARQHPQPKKKRKTKKERVAQCYGLRHNENRASLSVAIPHYARFALPPVPFAALRCGRNAVGVRSTDSLIEVVCGPILVRRASKPVATKIHG